MLVKGLCFIYISQGIWCLGVKIACKDTFYNLLFDLMNVFFFCVKVLNFLVVSWFFFFLFFFLFDGFHVLEE